MPRPTADRGERCSRPHCYAPEIRCDVGFELHDCPHWQKRETPTAEAEPATPVSLPLPWAGAALGTDDLGLVAARSAPRLLGIIGPQNAGKTTLLAAWYLLLGRGMRLSERLFAGSYSLGGWENLAHWLRWPPGGGPGFPPHTSLHEQRQPGLLHLAFRRQGGELEDVLLTDAPGEWFVRWAVNRDDPAAEGARWTVRKADALAVVVDCEGLAGPDRGTVRSQLFDLTQRLADERGGRPVVVVWAKSDLAVNAGVRAAVEERLRQKLPDCPHLPVTIKNAGTPDGASALVAPLLALLADQPALPRPAAALPTVVGADTFLSYRGK